MNVLSLFDGISGARQALSNADKVVNNYWSSEIDKYAIKVSNANWNDIQQIGNVKTFNFVKKFQKGELDLIIGGSPCQNLSVGNHTGGKGLMGDRSRLIFYFLELIDWLEPKYFILENVKMKKEYQDTISRFIKVEPVFINSADFTAQNRQRLYWTNIKVDKWIPKNIKLQDILESGYADRDKSYCVDANYFKAGANTATINQYFNKGRRQLVLLSEIMKPTSDNINPTDVRRLTPVECERLQGFPDNYTNGISNTQRYKALGNSFTVPVISHILRNI